MRGNYFEVVQVLLNVESVISSGSFVLKAEI